MTETAVPRITPTIENAAAVDLSRAHFVGIGGTGMLPLARVCAEWGLRVSGSNDVPFAGQEEIARFGAAVHIGHGEDQVPDDATAVVFTHAIGDTNPEIAAARQLGIPLVHRSTALACLMRSRTAIGVLGTHGKTSTAGMLSVGLSRMGHTPSYVIGGDLEGPASGGRVGSGHFFVAEVDESDRTHLNVDVNVAVVTNIEHDHPENYASELDHVDAYEVFVRGMRASGTLILNADSPGTRELAARLSMAGDGPRVVTFGLSSNATWRITEPSVQEDGRGTATLTGPSGLEFELAVRVPGVHQLLNATACVAAVHALGLDCDLAVEQFGYFDGVARRMSLAGEAEGVRVYDSYAHHPTEVTADLVAAHAMVGSEGRVLAVFQPAGQVRMNLFSPEFAAALAGADEVVLTNSVVPVTTASLSELAEAVTEAGGSVTAIEDDRAEATKSVASVARPGDVVVLMGTGDLVDFGPVLTATLTEQGEAVSAA
ncbi:UDP-N-acetylmuramate--L-alanine ligase [Streptomyces sp. NPDC050095]|uniref:UDP-N-acetylmuramate--L-alanine ligase n=1 Tax=unclassified Streptomyces TaxID=2593676 RepID=UPI003439D01F